MITISGFWFGVLMTIVVEIMLVFVLAIIRAFLFDDDEVEDDGKE